MSFPKTTGKIARKENWVNEISHQKTMRRKWKPLKVEYCQPPTSKLSKDMKTQPKKNKRIQVFSSFYSKFSKRVFLHLAGLQICLISFQFVKKLS